MMLRKQSLALATVLTALGGASAFDSVSAQRRVAMDDSAAVYIGTSQRLRSRDGFSVAMRRIRQRLAAPQRNRLPEPEEAYQLWTAPTLNRDRRMAPSMGGRGMRGGRVNGGMRGRRQ
jgi:hypothetical protein